MSELTGRTRLRVQERRFRRPLLVLQVEIEYQHIYNAGGAVDIEQCKTWRDAKLEDITQEEIK